MMYLNHNKVSCFNHGKVVECGTVLSVLFNTRFDSTPQQITDSHTCSTFSNLFLMAQVS
jgi:hypothetical protein